MECIYISLDQSTQKTGYCIWVNGTYYKHGLIDKSKTKEPSERLSDMINSIFNLLKEYKPSVITIEDTALQSNAKTLKDLAQLQGAIIGFCVENNIFLNIYAPSKWRTLLNFKTKGMKRKDLKEMALNYVKENFGFETTEDEAESICIGSAVLSEYKQL